MKKLLFGAFVSVSLATTAFAQDIATGDAEAGEKEFRKCKSCHMIQDADGEDIVKGGKTGPNLYGLYDRVAGSVEDFRYSDALVAVGEAGLQWNEEEFVSYVADPTGYLREKLDDSRARGKMSFRLRNEDDAKDIWAYLVSVGPEPEPES